ncbi:MAG: hypothetical protein AB1773_10770 [Pseudomonadota bacterium]|jgi:hypothetical protein
MNALRAFLVMLLVTALPLRATASVTAVFCLAGSHDAPAQMHGDAHGASERGTAQPEERSAGSPLGHHCGFCAKHCSGAAYGLAADAPRIAVAVPRYPIPFGIRPIPGFFPEHPERPPLPL